MCRWPTNVSIQQTDSGLSSFTQSVTESRPKRHKKVVPLHEKGMKKSGLQVKGDRSRMEAAEIITAERVSIFSFFSILRASGEPGEV